MEKDIMSEGFGIVAQSVLRDSNLSIEAKGIYSYLCTFANANREASVDIDTIVDELKISENRFFKYRKELVDKGYLIIKNTRSNNRVDINIYILNECKEDIKNGI